jgi:5-aminopentanamidase
LLETPHRFGDIAGALDRLDEQLREARGADLALLSEAALSGYVSPRGDFDLAPFAEPLGGPTASRLSALARAHGVALGAPLVERDGQHVYNSYLLLGAAGELLACYRKRHPWFPEEWATPGQRPMPRLNLRGVRLTLAVCFDIHFIEDEAADELAWADLLLFPSAWVDGDGPRDRRRALLPPLARRHDLWIANPNWGTCAPRLAGQGGSQLIDPSGAVVARAPATEGPTTVRCRVEVPAVSR